MNNNNKNKNANKNTREGKGNKKLNAPIWLATPLTLPLALSLTLSLTTLSGSVLAESQADVDRRIDNLEQQLEDLKGEVSRNRDQAADTQDHVAANDAVIDEARATKKGTTFSYGGYIKFDAMYSNYSEGKPSSRLMEEFMIPSLIPVENADPKVKNDSYQATTFHAKESRFHFGTATATDVGTISTYIELDFILSGQGDERISNSYAGRLRHAFVKWQYGKNSSFLAGQAWSTFFNVAALPDLQDFVGPVGTIFERQPLMRWTFSGFQFALENAFTRLNGWEQTDSGTGALDVQSDNETIPDVVLRYNGKAGSFAWTVAALGRQLSYEHRSNGGNTKGDSDEAFGYGLNFSGVVKFGRNDLRFSALFGDALGRYFGVNAFNDGYIDADGNIKTFNQYGGFIAYRQFWSDRWRSTFSISAAEADNPDNDDVPAGDQGWAKAYQTAHVNLNYMPVPAFQLGGELIYGRKEVEDGRDGTLNRFQFTVKYAF